MRSATGAIRVLINSVMVGCPWRRGVSLRRYFWWKFFFGGGVGGGGGAGLSVVEEGGALGARVVGEGGVVAVAYGA